MEDAMGVEQRGRKSAAHLSIVKPKPPVPEPAVARGSRDSAQDCKRHARWVVHPRERAAFTLLVFPYRDPRRGHRRISQNR